LKAPQAFGQSKAVAEGISRLNQAVHLFREEARAQAELRLEIHRELQDARDRFSELYDEAPIGYLTLSRRGVIVESNATAASLLGDRRDRIIGKPMICYVARADGHVFLSHLLKCSRSRSTVTTDVTLKSVSGSTFPAALCSKPSRHPASGSAVFLTTFFDISARNSEEQELREAERRYRDIVESTREGIWVIDRQQRTSFVNRRMAVMLASTPEEIIGRPAAEFLWTGDGDQPNPGSEASRPGTHDREEIKLRRRDGSAVWTSVSTSAMKDDAGTRRGTLRLFTDLTRRKQLDLSRQRLLRHLVEAQEAERRRVARELHDQMGQYLTVLKLGLERLADPKVPAEEAGDTARRLRAVTEGLARDVQHLAWELRPAALDDLGLEAALANYAGDFQNHSGIVVEYQSKGLDGTRLPFTVETSIYRIVQEALTNVAKHAQAHCVSLIVERRSLAVLVIVEDDGVGFDVHELLPASAGGERLGLLGIQERAALVGGKVEIESSRGRGTTLFVRIPLRSEELQT
jgi:PAS domain S-box-containing protein